MKEQWKKLSWGDCDRCGSEAEVFTSLEKEDFVYDGDKARCQSCKLEGSACTEGEEGDAYIDWNDFEEEIN